MPCMTMWSWRGSVCWGRDLAQLSSTPPQHALKLIGRIWIKSRNGNSAYSSSLHDAVRQYERGKCARNMNHWLASSAVPAGSVLGGSPLNNVSCVYRLSPFLQPTLPRATATLAVQQHSSSVQFPRRIGLDRRGVGLCYPTSTEHLWWSLTSKVRRSSRWFP